MSAWRFDGLMPAGLTDVADAGTARRLPVRTAPGGGGFLEAPGGGGFLEAPGGGFLEAPGGGFPEAPGGGGRIVTAPGGGGRIGSVAL